jgi:hypothetical protein
MPKTTDGLPGIEGEGVGQPKRIKRLDNAIDQWRSTVDQRMLLTDQEVKQRARVEQIMNEEGIKKYAYNVDDEIVKDVVLDVAVKVKMTKHADPEAQDDDENEED